MDARAAESGYSNKAKLILLRDARWILRDEVCAQIRDIPEASEALALLDKAETILSLLIRITPET